MLESMNYEGDTISKKEGRGERQTEHIALYRAMFMSIDGFPRSLNKIV